MKQLKDMRDNIKPAEGEFWIAAGISFTSSWTSAGSTTEPPLAIRCSASRNSSTSAMRLLSR